MAYADNYSPSLQDQEIHLIQPLSNNYSGPHPLALVDEYILSFVATDPDKMTLKEALTQPDRAQFLEAMKKELNDHISRGH